MHLLLLFLISFPSERIATLPTGALPERGVWQLNISHRFVPAVFAPNWTSDVLQFFNGADVRDALDKSLSERVTVGGSLVITTREAGVHAAWAPLDWLTLYPELTAVVRDFDVDNAWFNVGVACHRTIGDRLAVVAQPRLTANRNKLYVSTGLGAKVEVLPSWSLGLEAEPVIFGRDSLTQLLPWTFAVEKQYGWHNFVLTLGSSLRQSPPGLFRSPRTGSGYDDMLDLTKGHFRVGFNILRKI